MIQSPVCFKSPREHKEMTAVLLSADRFSATLACRTQFSVEMLSSIGLYMLVACNLYDSYTDELPGT